MSMLGATLQKVGARSVASKTGLADTRVGRRQSKFCPAWAHCAICVCEFDACQGCHTKSMPSARGWLAWAVAKAQENFSPEDAQWKCGEHLSGWVLI